jgi:hypothetical protein
MPESNSSTDSGFFDSVHAESGSVGKSSRGCSAFSGRNDCPVAIIAKREYDDLMAHRAENARLRVELKEAR